MKTRSVVWILGGFLVLLGSVGAMESETVGMARTIIQCFLGLGVMFWGYLDLRRSEMREIMRRYERMKAAAAMQMREPTQPMIGFVK